jgi:hypothetical protein
MENTYENYLRRPVYTFNNVQFLNSSKMKLKKQVLMYYLIVLVKIVANASLSISLYMSNDIITISFK